MVFNEDRQHQIRETTGMSGTRFKSENNNNNSAFFIIQISKRITAARISNHNITYVLNRSVPHHVEKTVSPSRGRYTFQTRCSCSSCRLGEIMSVNCGHQQACGSPPSTAPRWNDTDRGKLKNSEKNLSQCHSVHHKSYRD
jgi:hypothetical protein